MFRATSAPAHPVSKTRPESGVRRHTPRVVRAAFAVLIVLALYAPGHTRWSDSAAAATILPAGFSDAQVAAGIVNPTAMAIAPDGRIFVCEKGGRLRVVKAGTLLAAPFLTVTVNQDSERGLVGVTLDPDFSSNGYVYVNYTATSPVIHQRISRFTASGDIAVSNSERAIFDFPSGSLLHHIGGGIHFGPDGKLYVSTGDNSTPANAQSLGNVWGKLLRINPDGSIPGDNPFFNSAVDKNRAIWALGLRNPYTFGIQPDSGKILIGDVGENTWEELNEGVAGANYGWPTTEGSTDDPAFHSPIFTYEHGSGDTFGCAIIGGAYYNPATAQFPSEYVGRYFFSDYCNGWIRTFNPADGSVSGFATGMAVSLSGSFPVGVVDLQVASDGSLYYLNRGNNTLNRIQYQSGAAPAITLHPANQTVATGQPATFNVSASGSAPLRYQWRRNGVDIPGANQPSYTLPSASVQADSGVTFRCKVSNSFGAVTSAAATLTVISNQPPSAAITAPTASTLYKAGTTIKFAGSANDAEDGALPASAFTWQVDFHHDQHIHPHMAARSGIVSGSFTVPNTGEVSANVWYRITLSVKDSAGLTRTVVRDVRPRTATIKLDTSPAGLQVTLNGQPATTPASILGVVGMKRTLGVVTGQNASGARWTFDSWSDGGGATHDFTTLGSTTTYRAVYRVDGGSVGTGAGLRAVYFNNMDLTGTTVTRVDPTVLFNWGSGAPAGGIDSNSFSVRWTGTIAAQFSQTYTFYTLSDDGVRLWVNGKALINNWTSHSLKEDSGTITLTAGQQYTITLEYFDNSGGATINLLWSSPSTPKSAVPKSQLYASS